MLHSNLDIDNAFYISENKKRGNTFIYVLKEN